MNDVCERKHGGVFTSRQAFERAKPNLTQARQDVLLAVEMSLDSGITAKEYAEKSGKPLNAVSGRFTELARDGWIERSDERRDGAAVWKSTL
jgi:predicted transcriptional regulator